MTEHTIDLSLLATLRDGTGHSIYSPSSASMWLTCSGSLIPNVLASDSAGEDAAYGTVAHGLTEQQLKTGRAPVHRLGDTEWVESGDWGYLIKIDEAMLSYVQECVDYCEWLSGDHFVEQRVDFSEYTPLERQSGTCDHCACEPGLMTITDHKFGEGVKVYAAENRDDPRGVIIDEIDGSFKLNGSPQGLLYALGFFLKHDWMYDFEKIVIRIAQPRLDHWDEWTTTREHLLAFADFVRERAALAWKPNQPRTPSVKGCRWCKVKSDCGAWASFQEDLYSGAWVDLVGGIPVETIEDLKERLDDPVDDYKLTFIDAASLSTDQLAQIYAFRSVAEGWWANVERTLYERAQNGEKIRGMKLVEARANRVFEKPKAAADELLSLGLQRNDIFNEKMVSPAQAEELLRKKGLRKKQIEEKLKPLVYKPSGNPTLVSVNDKRPALENPTDDAFADLVVNL